MILTKSGTLVTQSNKNSAYKSHSFFLALRMEYRVCVGFEPQTPFVAVQTNSIEMRTIENLDWLNWSDDKKRSRMDSIKAVDIAYIAVTRGGVWIKYSPEQSGDKSPFVFFVQFLKD